MLRKSLWSVSITAAIAAVTPGCGLVHFQTNADAPRTTAETAPVATHPGPKGHAAAAKEAAPAPEYVTVTDRFPDMTEADSLDLAKIKSVIDRATPDMVYAVGSCSPTPFVYLPAAETATGQTDPDFVGVENDSGTPDHPFAEIWTAQGSVRLAQRMPSALAPNTPLLLWQAKNGSMLAVTFDGGRYRIDGRPYGSGSWEFKCGPTPMVAHGVNKPLPPPVQTWTLTSQQILALEKTGQMPNGTAEKIEAARAAASECTDRLWAQRFDARDKANANAAIRESTRRDRRARILGEYQSAMHSTCAAPKKRFDTLFEAAIAANKARRLAFYQSVSNKLEELTAGTR